MCGRFTHRRSWAEIHAQLSSFTQLELPEKPRYNIAPTQDIAVVRLADGGRELTMMRWGLIPSWSKEMPKSPQINARAETVAEKPMFRSAFKSRRCLIPADGYYEWMEVGAKKKQPYLFELQDSKLFAFAGLWEKWHEIESCTIITTEANELAVKFHDRMPAILSPNDYAEWLDPQAKDVGKLLTPYPADEMTATAINPVVNNARNETPQCIEPID